MGKFYFFKSSVDSDNISGLTVFANSLQKAVNYARKTFAKFDCVGEPQLMAI